MPGILPPDLQEIGASVRPERPRRLSRRRVSAIVRIGQVWVDLSDGTGWTVAAVYHKDGVVRLERPRRGWTRAARFRTFGELGRHYRLQAPTMARGP